MNIIAKIEQYCRENIEDYELRVQVALGYMDRLRVPLMVADSVLCCDIEDCITEYCVEYGVSAGDIEAEDIIFRC